MTDTKKKKKYPIDNFIVPFLSLYIPSGGEIKKETQIKICHAPKILRKLFVFPPLFYSVCNIDSVEDESKNKTRDTYV